MSTQPLEQAIASSHGVLVNVTPAQLGNSTPCASWTVADLINHMVGGQVFFAAALAGDMAEGDTPDFAAGDFVAAFDEASAANLAAFGADGVMETMYTLPFGEMPGSAFMGLVMTDTFQHAWDLAKATGQSTDLAPQLADALLGGARAALDDSWRGPEGAPFGAEQQTADDAASADQLAAFLGRTV